MFITVSSHENFFKVLKIISLATRRSYEQMRVITEGQKYPINPPGEGFCARISGASFDCVGFMSNISTTELNEFRDNDLRYGVYESPSTPFF